MNQTASPENEFGPQNLQFDLRVDQPFCCFDGENVSAIPVTLSIGRGAPLTMHDTDSLVPVLIGARLFANVGEDEEPVRGALLGEFRAHCDAFVAQKALHYSRALEVATPPDAPAEMLLDIDLVWEGKFWGSDIGHKPMTLRITQRRVAIRPAQPDLLDMTEALMTLHDARAREARYEAVIFALLNQLSERDR